MKSLKIIALLFGFLLMSCNESKQETTEVSDDLNSAIDLEKEGDEIKELMKNLYKWHEQISSNADFTPLLEHKSDALYIGLDIDALKQRIEELNKAGYFSQEFLDNYHQIGKTIDNRMRDKTLVWEVGGYPPFGNGANPWCNCQDVVNNYWDILEIENLAIVSGIASFQWTWGGDFSYKAKAIKENDQWRIYYLEGFDFDNFIK
ncbi:MAG TPA: hypothetical protein VLZ11_02495 [Flavobacterium sp.]|nr:hypothetical protein [Flavobacterium sp.]